MRVENDPPASLATEEVLRQWRGQYWMDLLGVYLGAPVKEVYPAAEVTNWMLNVSTPQVPLRYWNDRELPPAAPAMMTATNPVAYGHTDFFQAAWKPEWSLDREHVDQLYTHPLLRMVSDDSRNRRTWAPGLKSVVWEGALAQAKGQRFRGTTRGRGRSGRAPLV